MKITYNKLGSGDNYGIQYHGDLKLFMKLIHRVFVEKKTPFALESHHGTSFVLVDYGLRLDIAARGWTHDNKGNGLLNPTFILKNDKWCYKLNAYGNTQHVQQKLDIEFKKGLIYLVSKLGLGFKEAWNHESDSNSVSVVSNDVFNYISHDSEGYETAHDNMVEVLKELVDNYTAIEKSLN